MPPKTLENPLKNVIHVKMGVVANGSNLNTYSGGEIQLFKSQSSLQQRMATTTYIVYVLEVFVQANNNYYYALSQAKQVYL